VIQRTATPLTFSAAVLFLCVFLSGCASLTPQDFSAAVPRFEPDKFFEGPVQSWGVIETRSGSPKSRVRANLNGRREADHVIITQDFTFEDGHKQQRVWTIRRIDEHRYEAAADDVIGPAVGYAFGNAFHWEYTLQTNPKNAFTRVRMEHWMYLLGDGETMLNRVVIRKFGVTLAQTTEYFHRGAVETIPTVEPR
jgi:hypothetical protein